MSNLENRYRRLLRVLPRWYRAEREEEMVGLLLADRTDDLDLEHGWPGWGETGATVALAVRTRFAASGAPARAVAVGDVVRLVAMLGLVGQAAYGVRWASAALTGPSWNAVGFEPVDVVVNLAMVAGPIAMLAGLRGVAKAQVGLSAAYGLVVAGQAVAEASPPLAVLWHVPVWVTAFALFAGYHRDATRPDPRPWWWALLAVAVTTGGLTAWSAGDPDHVLTAASSGLVPVAVVIAGVVHLGRRGSAAGSLALACWALALLPLTLGELTLLRWVADVPGMTAFLVGRVVCLALVGIALLVAGGARRPALPVTP
ncbi:hypothetical protein ACFFQW_19680 [Umezawaea endophytica]|uniref:Uncharacterized protein n=1 Tax=Umezawaea endophytica TaxID=1654476 RepID=A0A9X2VMV4_9PSEU|nr:hypothetical protein [Umezawaea endophytica]MCS7479628.1 hypothetical protein [Umezawaea endophytica]